MVRPRGGIAAAPYHYLGTSTGLDDAVEGLTRVEDLRFGTDATGGTEQITDHDALAAHFSPLEGDYDALGEIVGGAGTVTINSEVQNYAASFTPENHVLEPDGLRLQVTLGAGHWNTYLRGNLTSSALNGLYIAAPGDATPTATNISESGEGGGVDGAVGVDGVDASGRGAAALAHGATGAPETIS